MTGVRAGDAALDVCCGTGDFAIELRRTVGPSGRVVGLDFSPQMLDLAARKSAAVEWVQGDALELPFAPDTFAAACVGFGVRNLPDYAPRLRRDGPRGSARWPRRLPGAEHAAGADPRPSPSSGPTVACRCWGGWWPATPMPTATCRHRCTASRRARAGRDHARGRAERVHYRRLMLGVVALHVGTVPA